jgi:dihydrofolate reductase
MKMRDFITMEEVMRKIIESTLVSLDGVIGDPHLWAMNYFDNEAQEDSLELLLASDAMLMGRRTYEIFAGVWPARTGDYADRMNSIRKYVFSSTLERADWNNSTIIRGDVAAEVAKLKQQDGQDLVMYGHGPLGQTLLEHGLLDELRFCIHPLLVGRGRLLFRESEKTILKLIAKKTLGTGVVVLSYQPAGT